ncbi:MAG: response regulator [Candidatus Nitrosocosmicus sp.]
MITSENTKTNTSPSDYNKETASLDIIDNDSDVINSSSSLNYYQSSSSSSASSKDDSEQITFINYSHNYCISIVDIVESTKITDSLPDSEQIRNYYSAFLNTMASIIKQHNGKVIKNAGDCLIYYFPKTVNSIKNNVDTDGVVDNNNYGKHSDNNKINSSSSGANTSPNSITISNEAALQNVLDCGLSMIEANSALNSKLDEGGLPAIRYRISANYGRVELATSTNSYNVDLFGPTVNICSKINHLALPNQMVIYKDLYDILQSTSFFKEYRFEKIKSDTYFTSAYPVYSVDYAVGTEEEILRTANNDDDDDEEDKVQGKEGSNRKLRSDTENKYRKQEIGQLEQLQKSDRIKTNKTTLDNNKEDEENAQKGNTSILKIPDQIHDNRSNSSFNILLIDDDEDILFTFASIIESEGFKTTSISNPIKALNYFSQIDPYYYDLIVMDIRMPGLNGIQLYFKLKVMNPDIKVLFLSALDAVEELLSIFPEVKSSEIIRKPIESKELILKINTILKSERK